MSRWLGDPTEGGDELPWLLRLISAVLFISLLLSISLLLALQLPHEIEPLLLVGLFVLGGFAVPFTLLMLMLRRRKRISEISSRLLRQLSIGELDLPIASIDDAELRSAVESIRLAVADQRETAARQRAAIEDILNGMGEGLLCISRDRKISLANRRVIELFRVPEHIIGIPFLQLFRNAPLAAAFEDALNGRSSTARVTLDVDGDRHEIEIRVAPLSKIADLAAVALFIDVTELERLQRIRRDFLADFSHEVRTPLAGLRLAVDSLTGGVVREEQAEHLLKIIARQVARLDRLVAEVAELNEIESGDALLLREPVELLELLRDLCADFAERAAAANTRLVLEGSTVTADVDAAKVQQIFSNLIDNAIKHAPGSSEVRIAVGESGGRAIVSVSDEGPGISAEDQSRVFHRFYRLDKSRSTVEGTGLGLAIAKHLVLRHGGTIRLESAPGEGARFIVSLPKQL